jgi:uncharacterized protein YggT (Ycf19 family)
MALIDFILNLAALLLWWSWLAIRFDPLTKTSAASLIGTLRKADPTGPKRWKYLATLLALLLLRAGIYHLLSPALHWTPALELDIIDLSFRSDLMGRMLLFSLLSFALTLGVFYLWVLLLSVANSGVPDLDPFQRLVRLYFKWLENWPWLVKLFLPFVAGALLWLALHPILTGMAIVPKGRSNLQVLEQAALIGATTYLAWKYLIVGVLLLHLLNSYVYLGNHAIWNFINTTARNLLHPLRWLPLRLGKVDFLPLIGIALVFLVTETFSRLPMRYYHLLPF